MGGGMGSHRSGTGPEKGCEDSKSADTAKRLPPTAGADEPQQLEYRLSTLQVDLHWCQNMAIAWQALAERAGPWRRTRRAQAPAPRQRRLPSPTSTGTVKAVSNAVDLIIETAWRP